MRYQDIGDLSRRAVEKGGWLAALPKDPGADPPGLTRIAAYERAAMPARRCDFTPERGHR